MNNTVTLDHHFTLLVTYLLGKVDPLARNKNGKTPMYRLDGWIPLDLQSTSVTPTVRTLICCQQKSPGGGKVLH